MTQITKLIIFFYDWDLNQLGFKEAMQGGFYNMAWEKSLVSL